MSSDVKYKKKLVKINSGVYVPVSHEELNPLIGRLMQLAELTGDREQREALKAELKYRCRDWLNDLYSVAGYDQATGATPAANIIEVD